jgi:hypothetical protein
LNELAKGLALPIKVEKCATQTTQLLHVTILPTISTLSRLR